MGGAARPTPGAARVDLTYRHDTPQFAESVLGLWTGALVERFVDEPGWYQRLSQLEQREALAMRLWSEGRLKLEPWLPPRLRPEIVTMRPRTEIVLP